MTRPKSLGCLIVKDYAIGGAVRVPRKEFFDWILVVVATATVAVSMAGFASAAQPARVPAPAAVKGAIEKYFASQPNYEVGDAITRSQIITVLNKLNGAGAPVPRASEIANRGLADDSFIAQQFSTPAGRKFMRKLVGTPGSFASLDRLSSISGGEQLIRDLIRDPGGDKLIEYLVTTKGGHNMGRMMTAVPNGENLNAPTGRIYTVDELVTAINAAYAGSP